MTAPLRTAADLARDLPLSIQGKKLLVARATPAQFLYTLVHHDLHVDALRLMAVALLPREAVWWACLCCQHTQQAKAPPTPEEDHALHAAARWVLQPDEVHRAAAAQAGAAAGPRAAAGCAALAASHGGVAPTLDQPVVPLQPKILARLAGACVLLAASKGPPADLEHNYRQFVALGIDVDNHLCHWGGATLEPLRPQASLDTRVPR